MVSDSDIADEFAEYPMAPPVHGTSNAGSATHACIGTPTRDGISGVGEATTPLAELKARAILVREALAASLPHPPMMSSDLVGRGRELAQEAACDYEPTSRDIMAAISTLSHSILC